MDAVKVWAFSMCAAVVIASIVTMIVPSLEKQKMMKLIISTFVLAGVLSPTLNIIDEIELSVDASAHTAIETERLEIDETSLESLENNVSQALFPIIQDELEKNEFMYDFGLSVELIQEDAGISIECVNITVTDLHKIEKDKLKATLEENLGFEINFCDVNLEEKQQNE